MIPSINSQWNFKLELKISKNPPEFSQSVGGLSVIPSLMLNSTHG
jgi:hypothetical protein